MHLKRFIVAIILLPLLYLYVMELPDVYFFCLILLISTLSLWEFYSMYKFDRFVRTIGLGLGLAIQIVFYTLREHYATILILLMLFVFVFRLFSKRNPDASLKDTGYLLIPLIYIPCLLNFQLQLREAGPEWIILLYGSVWASDSFAFYIGKAFGKRRLYKEISPNKTLEGAFGSLLGGVIATYVLSSFLIHVAIKRVILTGLVIGLSAVVGDLIESMFKRDAGVKDSSNIIPGHGGLLDKIDGSLLAGPILWLIMRI